ncbi:hypothetical protein IC582_012701 [Cucumis melo]
MKNFNSSFIRIRILSEYICVIFQQLEALNGEMCWEFFNNIHPFPSATDWNQIKRFIIIPK